ncbi:hypothetical protein AVEN_157064-1 [Araneus ventricosus]|uniref:Uncharacterized protein n=1 Tax=Araneus ventricosus TaxID=182803 RepID=A0A4Y2NA54_ARAVE|nr:hypothetical protein AVEN_157064-1 [Araneus ventricosus]
MDSPPRLWSACALGGDLILDCQQYLIEFVVKIMGACKNKNVLTVVDTGSISHEMLGGKKGMVNFSTGVENLISKGKDGSLRVVSVAS